MALLVDVELRSSGPNLNSAGSCSVQMWALYFLKVAVGLVSVI